MAVTVEIAETNTTIEIASTLSASGDYALDVDLQAHIDDTTAAHAGTAISNTPAGNLAATTVQAALDELQTDVDGRAATSHAHATSDITSGTLDDARVAQSNVTQHQAALSVTESQISDLGTYEDALGNPGTDGYLLSSTTGGTRSWAENRSYTLVPPSTFDATVPFQIVKDDNGTYTVVGLDLSVYAAGFIGDAIFIDPAGSDSNPGTAASPLKSFKKAIDDFTENTIFAKPGVYYRNVVAGKGGAFKAAPVSRPLRILPWPGETGYIYLTTSEGGLSWVNDPTYTNTYTITRSVTGGVIDMTNVDANGGFTPLTKRASETEVNDNLNSWYINGSNKVFVRTFDDRAPDADVHVLVQETNALFTGNNTVYLNRCRFVGGARVVEIDTGTGDALPSLYADDCWFSHSASQNGFASLGAYTILRNCTAAYNWLDGFNYHAENDIDSSVFEINCLSYANGLNNTTSINNASTAHENARIVRVNGTYTNCKGPIIADIDTTQSWMIGCAMSNSQGAGGQNYSLGGVETWLDGCTFPATLSTNDIIVYSGGTIYLRNTTPREGTGTQY